MNENQGNILKEYNRLFCEADKIYHEIALKAGISDSAFTILYTILEIGDGCQQKDICDMHGISKQTINSSIRKLEKDGYLEVIEENRKNKKIVLTSRGRKLAEEKILPVIRIEQEILMEMSEQDRETLLKLMKQYLQQLEEKTKRL